jgi:flavin-dependent dehydrogenase
MKIMETYHEKERDIPVTDNCDVLVLGAGPAGFGAALSAAREGADTILVEQGGEVGGVATSGLMSHWTGSTKGGLFDELIRKEHEDLHAVRTSIISR